MRFVNLFYHKTLPLSYSDEHLTVLKNVIGLLLGASKYDVVVSTVPFLEPVVSSGKTVFISLPLVTYCINQPVQKPTAEIEFIKNVNLFDSLFDDDESAEASHVAACRRRLETRSRLIDSDADATRFYHTARIVLMAVHWYQHHVAAIPFDTHEGFRNLEAAAIDVAE